MVVLVDFAVDFTGAVDDGGVVPVAQQAAHLGGGKLQFVDQQVHGNLAGQGDGLAAVAAQQVFAGYLVLAGDLFQDLLRVNGVAGGVQGQVVQQA